MERNVWDMLDELPNRSAMGAGPMDYLEGDLHKIKTINDTIRIIYIMYDTNHFPNAYDDDFLLCL